MENNPIPKAPLGFRWIVDTSGSEVSVCLVDTLASFDGFCFPASGLEDPEVLQYVHDQVEAVDEKRKFIEKLEKMVEEANNG